MANDLFKLQLSGTFPHAILHNLVFVQHPLGWPCYHWPILVGALINETMAHLDRTEAYCVRCGLLGNAVLDVHQRLDATAGRALCWEQRYWLAILDVD